MSDSFAIKKGRGDWHAAQVVSSFAGRALARRTQRFLILLLVVVIGMIVFQVRGDSYDPPYSYSKATADGKYLIVMIAPIEPRNEFEETHAESGSEGFAIRSKYQKSGLYRNDGSVDPLWTVDCYSSNVEILPDNQHLILTGPSRARTIDDLAVAFYSGGEPTKEYKIRDLVDYPSLLPRSATHFRWRGGTLDESKSRYSVATGDGNHFVFDAASGTMIEESRAKHPWHATPGAKPVVILAILLLVFALIWMFARRRRSVAAHGAIEQLARDHGPTFGADR